MPRSRMFAIYGLLAVFALGAGLMIANFFGTASSLPSGYSTPVAEVGQRSTEPPAPTALSAPTAPSAGHVVSAPTLAPSPTSAATAPALKTEVSPTAVVVTEEPATETPAPTAAPTIEAPTAAPVAAGYIEYTVQKGDSLKSIGEKYGVTIRELINANQIPNPDSLTVGSVLRIPKK